MSVTKSGAFTKIALTISAALSLSTFAPSAWAAQSGLSPMTQRFLDNAVPNVDFLDRSSRLALENTKSAKVRDFAKGTATDATNTANAIYDWSQAATSSAVAANDSAPVRTGRSAAVDPAPDLRLARGQEDLDSLQGADTKEFDAQYKQAQIDALTQVQTDYQDYIAKGDDPALKALAAKELPKITQRLAAARKI